MNCRRFQRLLFEYVDGELSQREEASVAKHLAGCPECQKLLDSEKSAGLRVSKALHERAAKVELSTGFQERLLKALNDGQEAGPRTFESFFAFVRRFAWPAAIGAVAVMIAVLLLVRGHAPSDTPRGMALRPGDETGPGTVPVQAALVSTVYTFRLDGNQVVDRLEYRTNVVDGAVLLTRN